MSLLFSAGMEVHYASPSFGEVCRDRRLTTNFELWVEIFCVPTCFHMRIPKLCLSVCTPRKKSPWLRQYQSYNSNWYINTKVFTTTITITWKPNFFLKVWNLNLNLDLYWRAEINIQVGVNMHLYDNIGDASLSLRGSISSYYFVFVHVTNTY